MLVPTVPWLVVPALILVVETSRATLRAFPLTGLLAIGNLFGSRLCLLAGGSFGGVGLVCIGPHARALGLHSVRGFM